MLKKAISKIRRQRGNRWTPAIALVLSTAAFVLTLLVVMPGTKRGALENFHLLTLNTSNVGQQVINFTPITTSAAAAQPSVSVKRHRRNTSNSTVNSNNTASANFSNSTTSTHFPSSTIGRNGTSVASSTAAASTATATQSPIDSLLDGFLRNITAGIEGGICGVEGELGNFLQGFIQNITTGIESDLTSGEGDLGQLFEGIFKNLTTGLEGALTGGGGGGGGDLSSFIGSIIEGLTSGTGGGLLGSLTSFGGGLAQLFQGLVGNFTAGIDSGLSKAEGTVAEGITKALGIEQFYTLHLRDICAGKLSSASDPNADFNISACVSYSEAALGLADLISKIPTSTTVLSTNISIPAVAQVQEVTLYLTNLTNTLDRTIFAFYVLSLIASGIVIVGSLVGLVFPSSPAIMYANITFSIIAALSNLAGSATITAFVTTANNIVNLFGSTIGLYANLGSQFLALTWAGFGLSLLTNWYLLAVWFVAWRTISVKVQRRSPQDMGNWRAIFRESLEGQEEVQEDVGVKHNPTRSSRYTRTSMNANF